MRKDRLARTVSIGAAVLCGAGTASSNEVSPELQALRAESAKSALGGQALQVLRRVAGPGNQAALETTIDVLNKLGFPDAPTPSDATPKGDSLFVSTSAWALEVASDGNRIRLDRNLQGVAPPSVRLSYDEVVRLAKDALENELSSLVPLGAGEALVPLSRSDVVYSAITADGLNRTDTILESTARFGRSVDGVTVVGPGSRAMVSLDSDGGVTGFDIDWSKYTATKTAQQTVTIEETKARLQKLEEQGLLTAQRTLSYIACGYYDAGTVAGPVTEFIQPACVYHFRIAPSDGALDVAVPAGETYDAEPGWPESVALASGS